jgi:hypothetical protein
VWRGIQATVKGGINLLIGALNTLIRGLDAIQIHVPTVGVGPFHTPGFDWDGLHIPQIPKLATGGVVTAPTLALIGEAGPEAVIPLSQFDAAGGVTSSTGMATVRSQASQITALAAFTFGSMLVLAGDFHDRMPPALLDAFRTITDGLTAAVNTAADDVGKGAGSMTEAAQQFAQAAQQAAQQVASAMSQMQQQASKPKAGGSGASPAMSSPNGDALHDLAIQNPDVSAYLQALYESGRTYDDGGVLPPGLTMAVNKSGQPEHVFTDQQIRGMGGVVIAEGAVQVVISGGSTLSASDVKDAVDAAFMDLVRELRSH